MPSGYFPASPTYQQVSMGIGGAPGVGQTTELTFVNPRKFRVVVIACQGNDRLHPSEVSVGGAALQTTISVPVHTPTWKYRGDTTFAPVDVAVQLSR